jgi:hypothetical protein
VRIQYEFHVKEQQYDAYQKIIESLDDVKIWKGHLSIRRIDQNNRESILAFRNKKQIEWVGKNKENLSVMIKYGDGPLAGYQIFQVADGSIIIKGNVRLRGAWILFTRFAISHIIEGEINALRRLFPE